MCVPWCSQHCQTQCHCRTVTALPLQVAELLFAWPYTAHTIQSLFVPHNRPPGAFACQVSTVHSFGSTVYVVPRGIIIDCCCAAPHALGGVRCRAHKPLHCYCCIAFAHLQLSRRYSCPVVAPLHGQVQIRIAGPCSSHHQAPEDHVAVCCGIFPTSRQPARSTDRLPNRLRSVLQMCACACVHVHAAEVCCECTHRLGCHMMNFDDPAMAHGAPCAWHAIAAVMGLPQAVMHCQSVCGR
jgi:hypothetical protein